MYPPGLPSDGPRVPADLPQSASLGNSLVRVTARTPEEQKEDERDKILRDSHLRFRKCVEADTPWRRGAVEELDFVDGLEHWSDEQKRERAGLPCLTFDRIGPAVDQVVNNARQAPPEPKVLPLGEHADIDTAEVLQGLIRNISNDSAAPIAFMTAYEHAVKVGRGWWRVLFEYEHPDDPTNWEQKIVVKRVPNLFSVYVDPAAVEFDFSDMRFAFVTEDLDEDTYKELYTESIITAGLDFEGVGDTVKFDWFPKGGVRIAEYWWVETERYKVARLADGRQMRLSEVPEGASIIDTRNIEKRRVRGAKLNGLEVMETWDWPGKWIPLIPVLGREIVKNGKRSFRGMIRPAMDANLGYDLMASKEIEAIMLAPRAPYIAAVGQLQGFEEEWANANRKSYAVLRYHHIDTGSGQPLPPPQRNTTEPPIQAITMALAHRDNDIKATTSSWDPNLGKPGPQQSGRAIMAQQRAGDNAHFNYIDNLARSIQHTGRVIIDLTPHIYSEERLLTIADPDGSTRVVPINQKFLDRKKGVERIYQIGEGIGRYDVTVVSGPSYATRRQHGAEALMELTRTIPAPMTRALDLVVKALDVPDADQLADRLRPPDIQADQDGEAPPIPPHVQAQMQKQQQMIQALTEHLNALNDMIEAKAFDNASRERIAALDAQVKLIIAAQKEGVQQAAALMQEQFAAVKAELAAMLQQQPQPGKPQQPGQQPPPGAPPIQAGPPAPEEPEFAEPLPGPPEAQPLP